MSDLAQRVVRRHLDDSDEWASESFELDLAKGGIVNADDLVRLLARYVGPIRDVRFAWSGDGCRWDGLGASGMELCGKLSPRIRVLDDSTIEIWLEVMREPRRFDGR